MSAPDAQYETYQVTLIRACQRLESKSCDGKTFIPDDAFDATFTRDLLKACAHDLLGEIADHPETLQKLYAEYRKTITILVLMTYERSFVRFWTNEIGDQCLPIEEETLKALDGNLWWPTFNKLQYKFLARPFRDELEPQQWSEEFPLPILEMEYRNRGAFSEVYKIKIHPQYDQLNYQYEGGQEPHWYALKQLKTSADAKILEKKVQEWQDEVAANALMRKQHHLNILPLLHSHTYGKHCNLVFPLASYNLREFYGKEPHPPPGEPRLRFIERISRLVPALGMIHQGEIDSAHRWIGFHRDLKPDNILVFGSTQRFMISDLGLMKIRKVNSSDREYSGVEWGFGLSAYKAPECEIRGKKVGRGADIFSLGCILAEAITWCVCGKAGIEEFRQKRSMQDSDGMISDQFFTKSSIGSSGKEIPRLKPQVTDWFEKVKQLAEGDPLICTSLDMVVSMLKENPRGAKSRPTAEKLDCDFYTLLKREAFRMGVELFVAEPAYYSRFDRRQPLPFSYSRSTSLMSATPTQLVSPLPSPIANYKRRRSEDESWIPPSLPMGGTGSTLRPNKKKKEVSPFMHLKRLDTMFLVDDYISETPWEKLRLTVSKLADIATEWDQDGVDLAFINNKRYFSCLGATKDVMRAMDQVGPSQNCECSLSRRLDEILSDYVALFRKDQFTKPLNMIIVTSGGFAEHDEFEVKVMEWAKELDMMFAPKSQLGLQFVLVGCSEGNVRRFGKLDEELYREYSVRDMVDATCYDPDVPADEQQPKIFEKIMCGGMIKTFDRMMEGSSLSDMEMMMVG